jgi:hypothetical protein
VSSGKKSALYSPITKALVPIVAAQYPLASAHALPVYEILTQSCAVESLLFVSVIDMIERHVKKQPTDITLSVVHKDERGKIQTKNMELVHDVVVELQMAGREFRDLQYYLAAHGMKILFMHSCSVVIVDPDEEDTWYASVAAEQLMRTSLDWSGTQEKNVSGHYLVTYGKNGLTVHETIERIIRHTESILSHGLKKAA